MMANSGRSNLVDIRYDAFIRETQKAICVEINDEHIWFPKSIVEINEDMQTITCPRDFAAEKGVL